MQTPAFGTLYVVATPMGNLEDMTYRAVKILASVDLIAAEDTRHSKKLLNHYGITTRLVSCHEHNEVSRTPKLVSYLKSGSDLALISDAGTPCISDPGHTLVKAAAQNDIPVIPIPGCSAAIAGLSVSGLPTDRFLFLGFLPKKTQQLQKALIEIKDQPATLIVYESPNRILKLIKQALSVLGDRQACLTREMTKRHEEYIRAPLSDIGQALESKDRIRGEIALIINGAHPPDELTEDEIIAIIKNRIQNTSQGTSGLAKAIATDLGLSKKRVYDLILNLRKTL